MFTFDDFTMWPGGIVAWLFVGLISGWLAGVAMKGSGFGILGNIVVGLVGAMLGGFLVAFFVEGWVGFAGSILVAFIGACALIAIVSLLIPGRRVGV